MKILKINSLEKGFCDRDYLLLHAAFQILVDFIEKEKPGKVFDWSYDKEHRETWKEIQSLYRWWTKVRPTRKNPLDEKGLKKPPFRLKEVPGTNLFQQAPYDKKKYASYKKAVNKEMFLDKKWREEDTRNLHRLINIRDFLWT